MSFLYPSMIIGLLGMIIPIAIHILSNKQGKIRSVGSVKFFKKEPLSKTHSIQFNHPLLFIIRIIIITLLTFIIMEWFTVETQPRNTHYVLIDPSINTEQTEIKTILNSFDQQAEIRYLAKDFPNIKNTIPIQKERSQFNLLRSLAKQPIEKATIISHQEITNFTRELPQFPFDITWIPIEQTGEVSPSWVIVDDDSIVIQFTKQSSKEITRQTLELKAEFPQSITVFNKRFVIDQNPNLKTININNQSFEPIKPITVFIDPNVPWYNYFKSAIQAIQSENPKRIALLENSISQADWVISNSLNGKNRTISVSLKKNASTYFTKQNQMFFLQKSPKLANVSGPSQLSFVRELADIILPKLDEKDFRLMEIPSQKKSQLSSSIEFKKSKNDLLLYLLIFMILLERFYVFKRQSVYL